MRKALAVLAVALASATTAVVMSAAPAQAAVPDAKGWVLYHGGAVQGFGTWPAATSVVVLAGPIYEVKFPGQGAAQGIAHVTAVNSGTGVNATWCQVYQWFQSGPDEIVRIRCHRVGGAIVASGFSAFWTKSSCPGVSPGLYGYIDSNAAGGIISQFNSTCFAGNTITHPAVGQYRFSFISLGSSGPVDGSLQATAVNAGPGMRCKIYKWSSSANGQFGDVHCFNAAGAFADTRFTLTYQHKVSLYGQTIPPKYHGYFWNKQPLPNPNPGPATTNFNAVLGFGANTIAAFPPGVYIVTFPRIGLPQNTVQVTATSANGPVTSHWCNMNLPWTNHVPSQDLSVRSVVCFTNAGARVDNGFLVSASSIL